jgi:IS1 family transposase
VSTLRQTPEWPLPFSLCAVAKRPTPSLTTPLAGSYISKDRIVLALRLLIEGNSIRSTERITNLDRNTIMKLLVIASEKCEKLMGRLIVNIPVRDVQADEIWSFVGKKEKMLTSDDDPNLGDAYCFVAIERDTKLVLNFALGKRDQATANIFIEGLRHATSRQNFQITTDGFAPYISAISDTLSDRVDFARLIKVYRATPEGERRLLSRRSGEHGGGPSHGPA